MAEDGCGGRPHKADHLTFLLVFRLTGQPPHKRVPLRFGVARHDPPDG